MLMNLDFLPNSPALVSAGTNKMGTWLACYAADMNDSIDDIFDTLKLAAKIFQMGGGFGTTISKLREKGAIIKKSHGTSSGPIEFMKLFNVMVETVKSGGFRRGAQMLINEYNHPDIEEFIHCKRNTTELNNMNISVLIKDEFFDLLKNDGMVSLISPMTNKAVDGIPASLLFEMIAHNIWETGEPGVMFYERINEDNPTIQTRLSVIGRWPMTESVPFIA